MSKFSVDKANNIVAAMRAGAGLVRAAEINDVTRQTVWNWRKAGRKSGRGAKYEFDLQVTREEAKGIAAAERTVGEVMRQRGDLAAAANTAKWYLERRLPDEYGRHDKLTIDNGDLAQQLLDFLRERLDAETYDRVLAAISPDAGEEPEIRQLN
jgi:transposase-like protein